MTIPRRVFFASLLVLLIAFVWIWWNRPQQADLAAYVPASSLVYLECNNLMDAADAVTATDSWKAVKPFLAETESGWTSARTRRLIALTGIGPTAGVILARAQVAIVMLDLGTREQGETLTLKPEAALLIETHTSRRRIRSTVEESLTRFAEKLYQQPTLSRIMREGSEILVWTSADNNRRIVATIDDTVVIVANSERAVIACLETRRGQRPNLQTDPELSQMRTTLSAASALAFGFASSAHTAELLAIAAPLLFGRAPEGAQFDKLVGSSAPKIMGSAGWTAKASSGAIEDHYFFSLKPPIVTRMRPLFQITPMPSGLAFIPADAYSVTKYNFNHPAETWRSLQTTLSSQLDTLSAILMVSVLKSSLLPYGINDPERFLDLVGPEIMTARLVPDARGSILIARVRDETRLRELLKSSSTAQDADAPERRLVVHFQDGYVLMGSDEDVQRCAQAPAEGDINQTPKLRYFGSSDPIKANIVTYTKDAQRIRKFVAALARAQGVAKLADANKLNQTVEQLPYSITGTSMVEQGLDRKTRSAFGQFGAIVPLLFPDE